MFDVSQFIGQPINQVITTYTDSAGNLLPLTNGLVVYDLEYILKAIILLLSIKFMYQMIRELSVNFRSGGAK